MKGCGPNLKKFFKMNEVPEDDYFEAARGDTLTDADDVPGAEMAEEEDPIKGKKGLMKKGF